MVIIVEVFWQVIAPIFLVAGAGYFLARKLNLRPHGLSKAAFYVFTPCLLFDTLSGTTLSAGELGQLVLFAVLTIAGTALIAWIISRTKGYGSAQTSALVIVAMAGNAGNYGLPANRFAFGEASLEPAIVYFTINALILATVGVYLAALGRRSSRDAFRNLLKVPLTYAALAGLFVWATGLKVPVPIERATSLAAQGSIPVMVLLLGVQLARVRLRDDISRISLASAVRLIGGPLLGFLFAGLLGLTGINRQVSILEASMPTAVMATVLATEYDAEPEFTAGTVLVTTLASTITLTIVITLLR
ncbi:MAG: AEC family transporter [Chloroflexota bacterium]|nr:AEC family transporter [Chloroflexota bacterium]